MTDIDAHNIKGETALTVAASVSNEKIFDDLLGLNEIRGLYQKVERLLSREGSKTGCKNAAIFLCQFLWKFRVSFA